MKNIINISNKLKTLNKKLYIVWGFCRDEIMWNTSDWDIDLVTDARPWEVKSVLKIVWEVWKKYWTCIVSEWWEAFEITTFRKDIWSVNNRRPAVVKFCDNIEVDSKRRDFTFNAIYFEPITWEFVDPEWWKSDIKNNIIRFIWNIEDRIKEDALRILRFVRFKNKYNLKIAYKNYFEIIKSNIHLLKNLPIERIRQELDKIVLDKSNVKSLEDLKEIGFLDLFIPELINLEKCLWNKYHLEWNVWIHTKMCLWEMNKIIEREKIINNERKLILLWSIILHDIWKGPTYTIWEDNEGHYYNHENVWSDMFKNILVKRLNFSKTFEKEIYFLIKEHLRLFMIPQMKKLKSRKLMINDYFYDLILLWEADNKWRMPVKTDTFEYILNIYNEFKILLKSKKFLGWSDIIKKYPDLKWWEIWDRLEMLNNQILIKD